jgi:hypothetical protein
MRRGSGSLTNGELTHPVGRWVERGGLATGTKIVHDTVHDTKVRLLERIAVTGVVGGTNERCW